MIYIGIDNGLTGGLVALSDHPGLPIDMLPMPTIKRVHGFEKTKRIVTKGVVTKTTGKATANEINGAIVALWIRNIVRHHECTVVIEDCPEHARQKSSMRSMAISYGILVGAISAGCPMYRLEVVRSGNPKDSWQREMLGSLDQGDTKAAALAKAVELWPAETWLKTLKCKTPDTGLIDAALIAEFARIKKL